MSMHGWLWRRGAASPRPGARTLPPRGGHHGARSLQLRGERHHVVLQEPDLGESARQLLRTSSHSSAERSGCYRDRRAWNLGIAHRRFRLFPSCFGDWTPSCLRQLALQSLQLVSCGLQGTLRPCCRGTEADRRRQPVDAVTFGRTCKCSRHPASCAAPRAIATVGISWSK